MTVTPEQLKRLERDWVAIAGEPVRTEQIKGTLYGFTSELGALRLLRKYREVKATRAEYSTKMQTWYFSLDLV